jgi:ribonuclease PH
MLRQADGRPLDALRPVSFEVGFVPQAAGSALIRAGNTHVLCVASVLESVPRWLEGRGLGWVTAEYSMLPYATLPRSERERGQLSGRTQEIRRLIGRSLRMAVDRAALGERTIVVDCDVLQADGGTRTASITGGYVALALALSHLHGQGLLTENPLRRQIAAVSVGIVAGHAMLDLAYADDARADVDLNVVMTDSGEYVELQGTGEGAPYGRSTLERLLALADGGISALMVTQKTALSQAGVGPDPSTMPGT